jgi:transcriptional regulator with XRE-family HTH domain
MLVCVAGSSAAFVEELERHRIARGLTPAQLARAIGASTSQVSRWRRGGGISIPQLKALADWMGRPLTELMTLAGYPADASSALDTQRADDMGLAAVRAAWPALDEQRRQIIYEIAVRQPATAELSDSATLAQRRANYGRTDPSPTTLRDIMDVLQQVPAPDAEFDADLDYIRAEWRRAARPPAPAGR